MHQLDFPRIDPSRFVPEPEGVCPECGGRGWRVVPDGGAGRAEACDCRKDGLRDLHLAQSGIPKRYRACKLKSFITAHQDAGVRQLLMRARSVSETYADTFLQPNDSVLEAGLLFVGTPGTGKTHLAAALLAELIQRYNIRGRFIDFTSLLHQIQSTFDPSSSESKHEILDPIINAEVLVLDELGAQKPTEWVMDILYFVLNTRYSQRLATIFTTNYPLDRPAPTPSPGPRLGGHVGSDAAVSRTEIDESVEALKARQQADRFDVLSSRISARLVSRLYQMAQVVELPDFDYRREVKKPRIGSR